MYFGSATGYIFVHLRGEVDYGGDNIADTTFIYELGTDVFRRSKSKILHTNLEAGESRHLSLTINVEKNFDNVDMRNELLARSISNPTLSIKILDNVDSALSLNTH